MDNGIENFGRILIFALGTAGLFSIFIFSFGYFIHAVSHLINSIKSNLFKNYIIGNMDNYVRWCGYYFPQMEDFYNAILRDINNGWSYGECSLFRDEMMAKYGKREAK